MFSAQITGVVSDWSLIDPTRGSKKSQLKDSQWGTKAKGTGRIQSKKQKCRRAAGMAPVTSGVAHHIKGKGRIDY